MTRVLVTGAGGYIGRHAVAALLDRGVDVLAVFRGEKDVDARATHLRCGFTDIDWQALAADGTPDAVLHLAWSEGFRHDAPGHIDRLPTHVDFVRDALRAGIGCFAGLGSMHEIGYWEGMIQADTPSKPRSLYGIAKVALRDAARLLVEQAGMRFLWPRAYYITGDDQANQSIFSKILAWEQEGKANFPFTSGLNQYDFIDVRELGRQLAALILQTEVTGIVECCSGRPVALRDAVETFISRHELAIRPDYGAFPDRSYDSPGIWGDASRINEVIREQMPLPN